MLELELQDAAYTGLTDAQAVARLGESVALPDDTAAYTWAGLSDKLQADGLSMTLLGSLDSIVTALPGGTMLDRMLSSGGVNFASAAIQGQLTQILTGVTGDVATVVSAMLKVGKPTAARWESLGLTTIPTESDVAAARLANERQAALDSVYTKSTRANEAAEASLRAGDTPAQIANSGQSGWDGV